MPFNKLRKSYNRATRKHVVTFSATDKEIAQVSTPDVMDSIMAIRHSLGGTRARVAAMLLLLHDGRPIRQPARVKLADSGEQKLIAQRGGGAKDSIIPAEII